MINTQYGIFDGNTWEDLCQKCFKIKYEIEGYQEMIASPGDFGIEGFTRTGIAFQCYCPDEEYTMDELYEKQRNKITKDLNKLKKYENEILSRLSGVKIKSWIFVSPIFKKNDILKHCAKKKDEVSKWNLPFIDAHFDVQIRDADFYSDEIYQISTFDGKKLSFNESKPIENFLDEKERDKYFDNINRKNSKRVKNSNAERLNMLNKNTFELLINGDSRMRTILKRSPDIFSKLINIIKQFETIIQMKCAIWYDEPEGLIDTIKLELNQIIKDDLPNLCSSDIQYIVEHTISKWLAICPLDFLDE